MLSKYVIFAVTLLFSFLINYAGLKAQEPSEANLVINKIDVKGSQRVNALTIKAATKTRVGDIYNPQAVSQDVDAIWSLGFFDNIEVEIEPFEDGVKLIFLVTERPVVRDILFVGNRKIKTKNLEQVVEIRKGDYLKSYLEKFGEDKIRELYQEKGYYFADVVSIEEESKGYADIVYHIKEGPKVYVKEIRIEGSNTFLEKRLLKFLSTKVRKFPKLSIFRDIQ